MAINKVKFGTDTLMDITDTTALAEDVASGKFFYGADGVKTQGTATGGIDVSDTTATASDVISGKDFYLANGTKTTGTLVPLDVSDTTAAKANVLTGKYFYTSDGVRTQGSMANNGALGTTTLNATTTSKSIPAGYTSGGTVKISTTNLSARNIKDGVSMMGLTGTFTSDADADAYDILSDKTAYVAGSKVTGAYGCEGLGPQYNSDSSGCSTTALVVPCNFQPKAIAIVLNSGTYTSNRIIAVWGYSSAIVYHTKTSSSVARTQITSGVSSYWSWSSSTNKVTIKSASSTYLWGTNNYRVFLFK